MRPLRSGDHAGAIAPGGSRAATHFGSHCAHIDVQYVGPVTISRERVLAQMRTKIGQPYSEMLAEEDIRSLFATGQVDNVRIFGEPEGDGVRVIVAIQTRSLLTEIEIDGATGMSAKTSAQGSWSKTQCSSQRRRFGKGTAKDFRYLPGAWVHRRGCEAPHRSC